MTPKDDEPDLRAESTGITLLSVVLGVAVTVAVGIDAPAWGRALAGLGTFFGMLVALRIGSRPGRGPLSLLARWVLRNR